MIMSASISAAFFSAFKALALGIMIASPAIFGSRPEWDGDLTRVMDRLLADMPLVNGLAELMKNSKDNYEENGISEEKRFILTICDFENDSIHIIDLGGMNSDDVKQWKRWADDTALSVKGEGGQGMGGKAAMINIPSRYSSLETVSDGLRTKMGFETQLEGIDRFTPAFFIEDGKDVSDLVCDNAYERLRDFIEQAGVKTSYWNDWEYFVDVLKERQSYTIITLKGLSEHLPSEHKQRTGFVRQLTDKLRSEPQLQLTMEQSEVFFFDPSGFSTELSPEYPDGVKGMEDYIEAFEDKEIEDPQTGKQFSFSGQIMMRSSKLDMKTTPRLRQLNIIRVLDRNNTVWTIPMDGEIHEMPLAYRHAFGMISIDADLGKFADIKRTGVPDKPIARAITQLVRIMIEDFMNQIVDLLSTRTNTDDRDRLDSMMQDLQKRLDALNLLQKIRPVVEVDDDGVKGPLTSETVTEMFFFGPGTPTTESLILLEGVRKEIVPIVRGEMNGQRARVVNEEGKRADAKQLVELVSSDPSIVEVDDFDLIPHSKGTVEITMRIIPHLAPQHPEAAETSWVMQVSSLSEAPELILDPEPEVMFMHSNIEIVGSFDEQILSASGSEIQALQQNTGYKIWIEGDANMISQLPPMMRTKVVQDSNAEGTVFVQWGPNPSQVVSQTFSTSTDFYKPEHRKKDKGSDGKRGKFDLPVLMRCGNIAPNGRTIDENSEQTTLIRTFLWDQQGIVWLNPGSRKARALTLNPDTGKQYKETADQWKYFLHLQYGEMATEFLIEEKANNEHGGRPTTSEYRAIRDDVELMMLGEWYDAFTIPKKRKAKAVVNATITDWTEEE